jgi:hypothetical protein
MAGQFAILRLRDGSFNRERSDINAKYLETALGQPNGICPRTRADLERLGWLNATRGDELDQ